MKKLMLAICTLVAFAAGAETRTWLANVDGDWNNLYLLINNFITKKIIIFFQKHLKSFSGGV